MLADPQRTRLGGQAREPRRLRTSPLSAGRSSMAFEWLLAGGVVVGLAWAAWSFWAHGYLPQPFLYDVRSPLIGLYETAYWANSPGAYGVGQNIYPPLSFVFMKLFSIRHCYINNAAFYRGCDWLARLTLLAFFCLNGPLVYKTYRNLGGQASLPRSAAVCLGLPMLYALQCGNVIIVAFTFFVLGCGGLVRSRSLRWLTLAAAINFKPYLLILLVPPLMRRRWRWLAGCVLACGGIYGATWAIEGAGSPLELLHNLQLYAAYIAQKHWSDLYYATSYLPLIHFMSAEFHVLGFSGPRSGEAWSVLFMVLMRLAQVGVAVSMAAALFRPAAVNGRRLSAMILAMMLTTITNGQSGYVQIFLFFLVFLEPWRGPTRITILVATYLLCIPVDFALLPVIRGPAQSYLSGRWVMASFGVSVGQLARPAVLLIIQYGLIVLNLADSFGATRRRSGDTQLHEPFPVPAAPCKPPSLQAPPPPGRFPAPAARALDLRSSFKWLISSRRSKSSCGRSVMRRWRAAPCRGSPRPWRRR